MAEGGAGAEQGPGAPPAPGATRSGDPGAGSGWAGLPADLLAKVAETLVAQTEAGWEAHLKEWGLREDFIQEEMAERKRDGNCLFVFALVCKEWRKAQLKVGGRLRTRMRSDVFLPGSVALVKWALKEGCPTVSYNPDNGFHEHLHDEAAEYGKLEQVKWLIGSKYLNNGWMAMKRAAEGGNLEVIQWLRQTKNADWNWQTCELAVTFGDVEVVRWMRENGCPWDGWAEGEASRKFGYTDDFDNHDGTGDDYYGWNGFPDDEAWINMAWLN